MRKTAAILACTFIQEDVARSRVDKRAAFAVFKTDRATVYSRLVEGRFPPYKEILPKKANARIPLKVTEFMTAIRQAAIMTDEESKRVNFNFAPGKLTLAAQGAASGRSKVETELEYDGTLRDETVGTTSSLSDFGSVQRQLCPEPVEACPEPRRRGGRGVEMALTAGPTSAARALPAPACWSAASA